MEAQGCGTARWLLLLLFLICAQSLLGVKSAGGVVDLLEAATSVEDAGPTVVGSEVMMEANRGNKTNKQHIYNPALGLLPPNATSFLHNGLFQGRAAGSRGAGAYCYSKPECDVKAWEGLCQTGQNQSPIDLVATIVKPLNQTPVKLSADDCNKKHDRVFLANNGHSIVLQLNEDGKSTCVITHEDKGSFYVFSQLHFHWGKNGDSGSEHLLNGKAFPMEVHFVHYKQEYGSLQAAIDADDPSAISVVGVFIKSGKGTNSYNVFVDFIKGEGQQETSFIEVAVDQWKLRDLYPHITKRSAFRYQGSLTTPACAEKVLWNIWETPVTLSEKQIQAFRDVKLSHEDYGTSPTFRDLQPLNARTVEFFPM